MQASFSKGLETIKKKDLELLNSFTDTKNTLVETIRKSEKGKKQTSDLGDKGSKSQSEQHKGKRNKKNKNRAYEVFQLPRQGKEQPWAGRPASRLLSPLPARAHSAARVPRGRSAPHWGWGRVGKRKPGRLSTKPPAKVETRPKKATGKDESSDKKGKQGAKGKTGGNGHPRDCKIYLHQMEKLKTRKERSYV